MASTEFEYGTIIASTWLNDVDEAVYNTLPLKANLISPSFTTPVLGTASATSINKITITQPATGATLTIPEGTIATVSGTNTGDQSVFKTIAVSGQSDVVADSSTDTLTFAAGLGMTLTTNSATDTVTFTAATASVVRSARTSNTILGLADSGKLIDITSGTFTQTFTAAATLGTGWYCYIRNSGTGDITLNPNAAELIDGLTTYVMYPFECRLVQCDGTAFTSVVLTPYFKSFTTTGANTWTKPPGYGSHSGTIWSAGGGGEKNTVGGAAILGGLGGGAFPFIIPSSLLGTTETVTVGAGGVGATVTGAGGNGGLSRLSIKSGVDSITVAGGPGGISSAGTTGAISYNRTTSAPVAGVGEGFGGVNGVSVGSTSALWGGGGVSTDGTVSGTSVYGGGAGGCIDNTGTVHSPGTSFLGGSGGTPAVSTSGSAGSQKGGGGGATATGTTSGAGGDGQVDIGGRL